MKNWRHSILMNSSEAKQKTHVLFALAMSQAPLSLQELAVRTSKSYNTVKKIVEPDERVQKLEGRPVRYYLAMPDELNKDVVSIDRSKPKEGWVTWMQKIRPKLSRLTELNKELSLDAVKSQGKVIEAIGSQLILLGRELQEKSEYPDWYTQLGGDEHANN